MDKKTVILIAVIIAAVALFLYLVITKKIPIFQAAVANQQTVTLSPQNPSASLSITVAYGTPITFSIALQNGQPNSVYNIDINGNQVSLTTDSTGYGSTTYQIPSVTSSGTYTLTITGPGIPNAYTLTLYVTVQQVTTPTPTPTPVPTPTPTPSVSPTVSVTISYTPPSSTSPIPSPTPYPTPTPTPSPSGSGYQITIVWDTYASGIIAWSPNQPTQNSNGTLTLPSNFNYVSFNGQSTWSATVPPGNYVYVIAAANIPPPSSFVIYINGQELTVSNIVSQLACGYDNVIQLSNGLSLIPLTCCSFRNTSIGVGIIYIGGACYCANFQCTNCPSIVNGQYGSIGFMTATPLQ